MYEGEPVYTNEAIRARRTASGRHDAWSAAAPDSCPRTEDLVARSITVAIGPAWAPSDCDDVATAMTKVAAALL
jgi:hypothetical protein